MWLKSECLWNCMCVRYTSTIKYIDKLLLLLIFRAKFRYCKRCWRQPKTRSFRRCLVVVMMLVLLLLLFAAAVVVVAFVLIDVAFSRLQFYRWGIGCCRRRFVVVPMVILATMVGNQGTKMFAPNLDDRRDLCACTIQRHPHPISPQQTRAMWWTIASMPRAIEPLVMQHIEYYFPDLKRSPKRCMLLRSHATLMLCELVSFDVKCVSQFRRSHLRTLTHRNDAFPNQQQRRQHRLAQIFRHTFQKNQYQRIVMNLLNLVMFCDWYLLRERQSAWNGEEKTKIWAKRNRFEFVWKKVHGENLKIREKNWSRSTYRLVEMPYRDLFCGG